MKLFFRQILILFLLTLQFSVYAQDSKLSEQQAKEAVNNIVRHCGLIQNFTIRENPEVKTAIAYIKGDKRIIEYNPDILAGIVDSTDTDWSAVSILAHEIAHHLLGHTLSPGSLNPGDELACDRFSGFILYCMGASLEESKAAMEIAGNPHGTKTHPPKEARIEAIYMGWQEAEILRNKPNSEPITSHDVYTHKVIFEGDENNYYINEEGELLWFNNFAEPIVFGTFEDSEDDQFLYHIYWEDQSFYVDGKMKIWNITDYDAQMKVGELQIYQ